MLGKVIVGNEKTGTETLGVGKKRNSRGTAAKKAVRVRCLYFRDLSLKITTPHFLMNKREGVYHQVWLLHKKNCAR